MSKIVKETSAGAGGAIQGIPVVSPEKIKRSRTASELPQKDASTEDTEEVSSADLEASKRKEHENYIKELENIIPKMISETILKNELYRKYFTKKYARHTVLKEFSADSFINTDSTGINLLLKTVKNIQPKIKEFFFMLTSSEEQREVFRSSLIMRIKRFIELLDVDTERAKQFADSIKGKNNQKNQKSKESIFTDEEIATGKRKIEDVESDIDASEYGNQDLTGFNFAKKAFSYIQTIIENDYLMMSNETDKLAYLQYLIIHLHYHMSSWEQEIRKLSKQVE